MGIEPIKIATRSNESDPSFRIAVYVIVIGMLSSIFLNARALSTMNASDSALCGTILERGAIVSHGFAQLAAEEQNTINVGSYVDRPYHLRRMRILTKLADDLYPRRADIPACKFAH